MIYFRNRGLLPIEAVTTLGVSVKENDSPIGRFGTGLKYTIAGVLRLRGRICIHSGSATFDFHIKPTIVRGKAFDIVHMNDQPLGFTTDLGKHWMPWMYIRELWSNCKDESGDHGYSYPECNGDETLILVDCQQIEEQYDRLDSFILENDQPLATTKHGSIHRSREQGVFYQGILVGSVPFPSAVAYNIAGGITLTEDRTLASFWEAQHRVKQIIAFCDNEELVETLVTSRQTYENDLGGFDATVGDTFRRVVTKIYKTTPHQLTKSAHVWAQKEIEGDAVTTRKPSVVEQSKLDRAKHLLELLGFTIDYEPLIPAKHDEDIFGFVHSKQVYLTSKCLSEGTSTVAATWLEEHLHATEGLQDYSRQLQTRLFNLIVRISEEHILKGAL